MRQPWFSFQTPDRYPGDAPRYYAREALPGVVALEQRWQEIRDEVGSLFNRVDGPKPTAYFDQRLVPRPNSWKTLALYTQGLRYAQNCERLPRTEAILRSIPNLVSASLSWLDPHSEIRPHYGDTDAFARMHLGLVVPGRAPDCALEVGGEVRGWREGELTLFCDAYEHRAWNRTDLPRLVLIADVFRPEYAANARWYSAQVLSALALYKLGAKVSKAKLDVHTLASSATLRRAAQLTGALPFALYAALQPRFAALPPQR